MSIEDSHCQRKKTNKLLGSSVHINADSIRVLTSFIKLKGTGHWQKSKGSLGKRFYIRPNLMISAQILGMELAMEEKVTENILKEKNATSVHSFSKMPLLDPPSLH